MAKKAKKVVRAYVENDARMRQRMRTMQGVYETQKALFEALNPKVFTPTFGTRWLTALDTADEAVPGMVRVGELKEETEDVNATLAAAGAMAQRVFYYVGEAFPGRASKLTAYGQPRYEKARNSQPLMRALLETLIGRAKADKTALAAVGFGPALQTQLAELSEQLTLDETSQEDKKGLNTGDGDAYIETQNAAYAFGQAAYKAAQQLFGADASQLARFRLGEPARPRAEVRTLTLQPGERRSILIKGALLNTSALRLTASPGQVRVLRSPDATDPATSGGRLLPDQKTLRVTAWALGADGQHLVVVNEGSQRATLRVSASVGPPAKP